jgi:nitroreductase
MRAREDEPLPKQAAQPAMGLLEGIATTRSIHRYREEPVPEEDLATILHAATRAPSGSNSQPYRFLTLRDGPRAQPARSLLGDAFRASWAAKSRREGWDEGVEGAAGSRRARTARAMQRFVDRFEQIPGVILACMLRHREPNPHAGASIYPACQNLLLAARALGYGSCITMWHRDCEPQLRSLLGIPAGVLIAATLPLGRPEGRHGPLRRLPLQRLVFEDAWGEAAAWAVDPPGSRFSGPGSPAARRYA